MSVPDSLFTWLDPQFIQQKGLNTLTLRPVLGEQTCQRSPAVACLLHFFLNISYNVSGHVTKNPNTKWPKRRTV